MNQDFKELLQVFNEERVRYLIIGGYAVIKHTEPRYTKDLDLWTSPDAGNAQRVYSALVRFGAPLGDLTANDFTQNGFFFTMGIAPSPDFSRGLGMAGFWGDLGRFSSFAGVERRLDGC